ncbi:MAG: hypothetical protein LBI38_06055 [Oscillospiraceae bacterium]|jgi:hypothetical protein|nr:hypothetical protein [Oscillospiraceae bacterium]
MRVVYSLSTAPHYAKSDEKFSLERFELYTAAISALTRRQDGDKTEMHADSAGAAYIRGIGIAGLWDEVLVTIPDDFEGIDARAFWAAGKLFALRAAKAPLLMLDTDFIAWKLPEFSDKIVAAHREELMPDVYPPTGFFDMKKGYKFDGAHDCSALPLNTAFLYLPGEDFKRYYVARSLRFMKYANPRGDYLRYMVYAEQRLLAMCARYKRQGVETVLDWDKLRFPQVSYTHLWGAKQVMRENKSEYERFCEKCRDRLRRDFPEYGYVADIIEKL